MGGRHAATTQRLLVVRIRPRFFSFDDQGGARERWWVTLFSMWSNTSTALGFSWLPVGECTRGEHHSQSSLDALVGFGLVGAASAGICITLNAQKLVHNRNYDPVTGRQSIHFTRIPLWWAAVIANGLSARASLPGPLLPPPPRTPAPVSPRSSSTWPRSASRPRRWLRRSAASPSSSTPSPPSFGCASPSSSATSSGWR